MIHVELKPVECLQGISHAPLGGGGRGPPNGQLLSDNSKKQ